MARQGEKIQGRELEVLGANLTQFVLSESAKEIRAGGVSSTNTDPQLTLGIGPNDLTVENINAFGLNDTAHYVLTITAVGVADSSMVTIGNVIGGFEVGETVTGDTSGATGEVLYFDPDNSALFLINIVGGPFASPDILTGTDSNATADFINASGPFDKFQADDGVNPPITNLLCGSLATLTNGVTVRFASPEGHTLADVFEFDVIGTYATLIRMLARIGYMAIGDTFGALNGTRIEAFGALNRARIAGAQPFYSDVDSSGVTGLNDFTANFSQAKIPYETTLSFTIEIQNNLGPDVFGWSDGAGGSGTAVPIVASTPIFLSHGVYIIFVADTGHTLGDTWTFTAQRTLGSGLVADFEQRTMTMGDADAVGNGSRIRVDDINQVSSSNVPFVADGYMQTPALRNGMDAAVVDLNAGQLKDSAGNILIDWLVGLIKDTSGVVLIDWNNRTILDAAGNTRISFGETNSVRFYSNAGVELMTQSNTQTSFGLLARIASGVQIVNFLQLLSAGLRTADATLSNTSQVSQRYDCSTGDKVVTLPVANNTNAGMILIIKRILDGAPLNTLTVATQSSQEIDLGSLITFETLAPGEFRWYQSVLNGSTYSWDTIGKG